MHDVREVSHKDCDLKRIRDQYDLKQMGFNPSVASVMQAELDEVLSFTTVVQQSINDLPRFRNRVQEVAKRNEFFDQKRAHDLANYAEALLEHALNHPWNEEVPLIVAAVRYLIRTDDAQSDFEGLDGLEDDQLVLETIAQKYSINIEVKK